MLVKRRRIHPFLAMIWYLLVMVFGLYVPYLGIKQILYEFKTEQHGKQVIGIIHEKIVDSDGLHQIDVEFEESGRFSRQIISIPFWTAKSLAANKIVLFVSESEGRPPVMAGKWKATLVAAFLFLPFSFGVLIPTFLFHRMNRRHKRLILEGRPYKAKVLSTQKKGLDYRYELKIDVDNKSFVHSLPVVFSLEQEIGSVVTVYCQNLDQPETMVIYECSNYEFIA